MSKSRSRLAHPHICVVCGTEFQSKNYKIKTCSQPCGNSLRIVRFKTDPVEVRFFQNIKKIGSGCWVWTGRIDSNGYGTISDKSKQIYIHRWSYEYHKGPIPEGLVIDHLCRNHACVNPDHLEPVTIGENVRRGQSLTIVLHQKNLCKRGHSLFEDNVRIHKTKYGRTNRSCKLCARLGSLKRLVSSDKEVFLKRALLDYEEKAKKAQSKLVITI